MSSYFLVFVDSTSNVGVNEQVTSPLEGDIGYRLLPRKGGRMPRYPEGARKRAIKICEVILRATAKRFTRWQAETLGMTDLNRRQQEVEREIARSLTTGK